MKNKTMLPERVEKGELSALASMEYKQLYKKMAEYYSRMPFRLGREVLPYNPRKMSYEKVRQYIDSIVSGVSDNKKGPWEEMRMQAKNGMKHIDAFLKAFPNAEFKVDERPNILNSDRLSVVNAAEVIKERAMVDVPKEASDYFALVVSLDRANQALREYEQKNGLDPIGLGSAKEYAENPEKFARKWVDGFLKKKKITLI